MNMLEELLDELCNASEEVASAYEWGRGVEQAKARREDAKAAVLDYVATMIGEITGSGLDM